MTITPPRVLIHEEQCTHFHPTIELIGRRWNSSILLAVARGASRFGEIRASVPGLSDRMLAERARELQHAQLLERTVVPTTPVQVRYHLTERGIELIQALQPLVGWSMKWLPIHEEATG